MIITRRGDARKLLHGCFHPQHLAIARFRVLSPGSCARPERLTTFGRGKASEQVREGRHGRQRCAGNNLEEH